MRRRQFITSFGAIAFTWRLEAHAQQRPTKIPRIGIIDNAPIFDHFRQALRDLGYIDISPCAALKPLRDEARNLSKDVFSPSQLALLLRAAPSADWRTMIATGYFTGLRLADCQSLRWGDVDLDEGIITVETKKTRKRVVIPIHPQLLSWLKKQPRGIGKAPLFPTLASSPIAGGRGLSMQFKKIMKQAGIVGRRPRTLGTTACA